MFNPQELPPINKKDSLKDQKLEGQPDLIIGRQINEKGAQATIYEMDKLYPEASKNGRNFLLKVGRTAIHEKELYKYLDPAEFKRSQNVKYEYDEVLYDPLNRITSVSLDGELSQIGRGTSDALDSISSAPRLIREALISQALSQGHPNIVQTVPGIYFIYDKPGLDTDSDPNPFYKIGALYEDVTINDERERYNLLDQINDLDKNRSSKIWESEKPDEATIVSRLLDGLRGIGDAIDYISASPLSVTHRDVKPQNIYMDSKGKMYLGDFGVSLIGLDTEGNVAGSNEFMAPEIQLIGTYIKSQRPKTEAAPYPVNDDEATNIRPAVVEDPQVLSITADELDPNLSACDQFSLAMIIANLLYHEYPLDLPRTDSMMVDEFNSNKPLLENLFTSRINNKFFQMENYDMHGTQKRANYLRLSNMTTSFLSTRPEYKQLFSELTNVWTIGADNPDFQQILTRYFRVTFSKPMTDLLNIGLSPKPVYRLYNCKLLTFLTSKLFENRENYENPVIQNIIDYIASAKKWQVDNHTSVTDISELTDKRENLSTQLLKSVNSDLLQELYKIVEIELPIEAGTKIDELLTKLISKPKAIENSTD